MLAFIGLCLLAASSASLAAERRPISETDLLHFNWVADPQISPDGKQVVFVHVAVNEEKDRYETTLYVVPADGSAAPRPFTSGLFDSSPRWSPDGKWLAFVRSPEKNGDDKDGKDSKAPQIWLMPTAGGEARALTDLPRGGSSPRWSPDGKTIAFLSTTLPGDSTKAKKSSDVKVITRAEYRANGRGFFEPGRHAHIWTIGAAFPGAGERPAPRQLTSGDFDEDDPAWSRDGSRVYFASTRVLEPYYVPHDVDLFAVPAAGGDIEPVASIDGMIGDFALSPDGRRIAFVGTLNAKPLRSYDQPDLFVTDAAPGSTPRNLTADYDFDIDDGISADQHAPRAGAGGEVLWSRDGKSLFVMSAVHGRGNLQRVDLAKARVEPFTEGDQEVIACTASADGTRVAMLISTPTNIGDVFVADLRKSRTAPKQVTHVNEPLFGTLDIPEPEDFWYTSFDGRKIEGWILKPPGFDASKKYPMILQIHGGPHIPYGCSFTHEFVWMAAKGYVVLYTNPRGSSSYGQEFGNLIQFAYPGDDYQDLMAGVDEVVKRGYVDEKRLGVTGGSGGGVLTNWTVTQTHRFAAAVSQRSIADWYGFWFTADFTLFQPTWFRGTPWEDPTDYAARSAITHIANVTTPLMLIEGEADMRTPSADGGEIMFRALKYLKVPTVMVRFPGETHELSRSGKPRHRVERLQHIVGWFDVYLQGKSAEAYEVK